ncbi:hypothetical protein CFE70_010563 [Pyrenophora teres f. teres 0-1]
MLQQWPPCRCCATPTTRSWTRWDSSVEKTAYPRDSSVVDLFREQAAACPSRVAVKDSVAEMTYAQLDAASDVLARWLARRSLAPETLVGVFASRSCEAIVALGILKANLAYLPFDVKFPASA